MERRKVKLGVRTRTRFFARTAWVMAAMVVLGFPLTYFLPVAQGTKHFSIFFHIHGVAFFAWMALYVWQTHLAARGRVAGHRELGLAGIALSALLLPLGVVMTILAIQGRAARGNPHPFDFALYNIVDITTFTILMIAGIAAVTRHVDWHRRFTYGAALCLVGPAISRWFLPFPAYSPWTDFGPNILADLFLIALLLHDRRVFGKFHPASLLVILLLVPVHIATPFLTGSEWWRRIAPGLLHLT